MLGAESRRKKSLERTMFNEDDQENLYNLAQVCSIFASDISIIFEIEGSSVQVWGQIVECVAAK